MLSYGFGRSLVGFISGCAPTTAPASTSAAVITYPLTPPSLFPHVAFDAARADFGPIDDAVHVGGDAFGRARRARSIRVRLRIGDERGHGAVLRAADADAPPPSRVVAVLAFDVARFRVGDVEHVALVDVKPARPAELLPLGDEAAILVENLDPVVAAVGDEQPSLRIHREAVRLVELDAAGSLPADRLDER